MSRISNGTYLSSQGQIKKSVASLINTINEDEGKAYTRFAAHSELKEGFLARINTGEFEFSCDEPAVLGGNNTAPSPVELVLGALCACQEIVIKAYASSLDIPVTKVTVKTEGELDLRGFLNINNSIRPGFHTVTFQTIIDTTETNAEKLDLLKKLAEEQCPVLDIIQNPVKVKGTITYENTNN